MPATLLPERPQPSRLSHRFAPSGQTRFLLGPAGRTALTQATQRMSTSPVTRPTLLPADTGEDASREVEVAVLSCDLKGFTAFADAHSPLAVVQLLDRAFTVLGDQILRHGGVIYQYAGDQIIGLFGVDGTGSAAEHCRDAVRAGLGMLDALPELNARLTRELGTEIDVRIGGHFGKLVVGYIGHPSRCVFSAIGDAMNVTCRVEATNKALGTRFLITGSLFRHLVTRVETGRRAVVTLKGKREPHPLVEVRRFLDPPTPETYVGYEN